MKQEREPLQEKRASAITNGAAVGRLAVSVATVKTTTFQNQIGRAHV